VKENACRIFVRKWALKRVIHLYRSYLTNEFSKAEELFSSLCGVDRPGWGGEVAVRRDSGVAERA